MCPVAGAAAGQATGAGLSRGARRAGAAGPPGHRGRARGIPLPAAGRLTMRAATRHAALAAVRSSSGAESEARSRGRAAGAESR